MSTRRIPETAVAGRVVQQLRSEGWEVHEEVKVGPGCADIIAVLDVPGRRVPLVRHIECKTGLTADLVGQAMRAQDWRHSHTVEVAYPMPKRRHRLPAVLDYVIRHRGIGVIEVRMDDDSYTSVPVLDVVVPPKLVRVHNGRTWWRKEGGRSAWLAQIRSTLAHCARHENLVPAGTPGNKGRWTPYRGTMHQVRRLIEARGEVTLREIMGEVGRGHYATTASAKAAIPHALEHYEADWCTVEFRSGRNHYRLVGTAGGCRVPDANRRPAEESETIPDLFSPVPVAPGAFVLP